MNDPYNGNGRKSPEDDLGRSIEKEVKETIGTVAAALQDAAREVSTSLRDNESVQGRWALGRRPGNPAPHRPAPQKCGEAKAAPQPAGLCKKGKRRAQRGGRPDAACGHFGGVRVFFF